MPRQAFWLCFHVGAAKRLQISHLHQRVGWRTTIERRTRLILKCPHGLLLESHGTDTAAPLATAIADRIDTLVVDEAHHVKAVGWAAFRDAFAQKRVLQLTATPFRRDGQLVNGHVIYNYPLRQAQQDDYFRPITFEPVYELDQEAADRAIAETAIAQLRTDLSEDFNHLLMARCDKIDRARSVIDIYREMAPDLTRASDGQRRRRKTWQVWAPDRRGDGGPDWIEPE